MNLEAWIARKNDSSASKSNKKGLQPVSKPVEQEVVLF